MSNDEVTMPALKILKAAPQHAEEITSSGLAMLLAICAQWDALGCSRSVCWSNSRLAERCGLSRNSVAKVREKLMDQGWLIYLPDGRKSGHYTPKLPEWYAQSSAVECANGVQLSVQTVCKQCAVTCAITVQMRVTYIPIPIPSPSPNPEPQSKNAKTPSAAPGESADQGADLYTSAGLFAVKGGDWQPTQAKVEEWIRDFPSVNVHNELTKAARWTRNNETRRKTARGMHRFVASWLTNATPTKEVYDPMDDAIPEAEARRLMGLPPTGTVPEGWEPGDPVPGDDA